MTKSGIFISYSDIDGDKVNLIVSELESNTSFFPIVIASNREALKPLAQKVAEGIIQAKIILPILTTNSITSQWLNQEIGFATALKKRIMPIAEADLIDKLKGFIHKQIDLPYNYKPSSNKVNEENAFLRQVRNLLSDLERDLQGLVTAEELPMKTEFEKSLEHVDKMNEELEFQRQRNEFLSSVGAVDAARMEVLNMFMIIEEKTKKLEGKQLNFGSEKEVYQPSYILKCGGFSFSIAWQQQYNNSNEGAFLYVRRWKGNLTKDSGAFYFPGEEPKMISDVKYVFDRNRKDEICWLNQTDKKQSYSEQIVDACLGWMVEEVARKRLKNG